MIDNELVGAAYIDIFLITWSWDVDLIINTRIQFIFFINCCACIDDQFGCAAYI